MIIEDSRLPGPVEIPVGWEFVCVGTPTKGDSFINRAGTKVLTCFMTYAGTRFRVIVKRQEMQLVF